MFPGVRREPIIPLHRAAKWESVQHRPRKTNASTQPIEPAADSTAVQEPGFLLLLCGATAESASASTASVSSGTLTYTGAAGETNNVTISLNGSDHRVNDTGATITAGAGCSTVDSNTVDLDGTADDGEAGENDNIAADLEDVTGGSGNDSLTGS